MAAGNFRGGYFSSRYERVDATFRKTIPNGSHAGTNLRAVRAIGAAMGVIVGRTSELDTQADSKGVVCRDRRTAKRHR
ncbi:hypothetical protein HYPDE_30203 [Hyphomicrobium denitrificans 1NES1]|uniref:Uncharacterized protein n=1 Tax=Hyphomicrobium denitrificans 1NES1 TaxID=670307 RepID=N0BC57_9HYPH|nr:hypothetical protein HYPDE_30203 [Hyphomicrobium denitrificans 1NES1]